MINLEKINDILQFLAKSSDGLKEVKGKGGIILSLLPWISVMHLYHTASEAEKRVKALEKRAEIHEQRFEDEAEKAEEHAVIYAGSSIKVATEAQEQVDQFMSQQQLYNQGLDTRIKTLERLCRKKK